MSDRWTFERVVRPLDRLQCGEPFFLGVLYCEDVEQEYKYDHRTKMPEWAVDSQLQP